MTWRSLNPSTPGGAHLTRLTDEQFERIHAASLEILERIGVRVDLEEARVLLKKGGAQVEGNLVRVPRQMVESALASAPKKVTLHNGAASRSCRWKEIRRLQAAQTPSDWHEASRAADASSAPARTA
jgi:trimethylamine:corrinoid methyltransferase-like protein